MAISKLILSDACWRLHGYLLRGHWDGTALAGPDPGIRFNSRIGRFVKSYLSFFRWSDHYVYAQAQKYWILNNLLMGDLKLYDKEECLSIAVACSKYLVDAQNPEGYWPYPNPEWKGRIATVEGNYAAIALLETYRRTRQEEMLAAAEKWYHYVMSNIGFQGKDGFLAVNYFGNKAGSMVPNNSASAVRCFAKLADVTKDDQFLAPCKGMVDWLIDVQMESGELPYAVKGTTGGRNRIHFLCFQYNAFQFLNLAEYFELTGDKKILPVLQNLASYLSTGINESGAARYECGRDKPEVPYYTAALAAALSRAAVLGMGDYYLLAESAYNRVLSQQTEEGGLAYYSSGNYGFLSDRRSYPRYLSMILHHLLVGLQLQKH